MLFLLVEYKGKETISKIVFVAQYKCRCVMAQTAAMAMSCLLSPCSGPLILQQDAMLTLQLNAMLPLQQDAMLTLQQDAMYSSLCAINYSLAVTA